VSQSRRRWRGEGGGGVLCPSPSLSLAVNLLGQQKNGDVYSAFILKTPGKTINKPKGFSDLAIPLLLLCPTK
jgi:hypothetical protein